MVQYALTALQGFPLTCQLSIRGISFFDAWNGTSKRIIKHLPRFSKGRDDLRVCFRGEYTVDCLACLEHHPWVIGNDILTIDIQHPADTLKRSLCVTAQRLDRPIKVMCNRRYVVGPRLTKCIPIHRRQQLLIGLDPALYLGRNDVTPQRLVNCGCETGVGTPMPCLERRAHHLLAPTGHRCKGSSFTLCIRPKVSNHALWAQSVESGPHCGFIEAVACNCLGKLVDSPCRSARRLCRLCSVVSIRYLPCASTDGFTNCWSEQA